MERPPRCFLPPLLSLCSGRFPGPPVPVQPSPAQPVPVPRRARGYLQEKASGCRSPMMERRSARDGAGGTGRTARHGSARLRQETGAGGSAFPPGGGAGRGPRPRTGYVKRSGAAGGRSGGAVPSVRASARPPVCPSARVAVSVCVRVCLCVCLSVRPSGPRRRLRGCAPLRAAPRRPSPPLPLSYRVRARGGSGTNSPAALPGWIYFQFLHLYI